MIIKGSAIFSVENLLFHAAVEYEKLMDIEYDFQFGRKNKLYAVNLIFPKDCFHHMAGLKKLNDSYIKKKSRNQIFDKIKEKSITENILTNDPKRKEVEDRLFLTEHLEEMLENDNTEYLFLAKNLPFDTRIDADYIFVSKIQDRDAFIFIKKKKNSNFYFCRSLFYKGNSDFSFHQPKLTLLYKGKKNLKNGISETLYGAPKM